MNRLIIDKKGTLKAKNYSICFEDKRYPLRKIDFLILADEIVFDTKTISYITKNDTSILIYNKGFSFIHPISSKNAQLKKAQYLALDKRIQIAKWIVLGKIKSSFIKIEFDIKKLQEAKTIEEILGIEGAFSKIYFSKYFSLFPKDLRPKKRTKHPPKDVVNAMLSFVYTILYYEITNELIKFGFEPQIGYLHEPFRSHNALSSDILEFFRAKVDEFVLELFLSEKLKKADFTSEYRLKEQKRKELWKEIKIFLQTQNITKKISNLRGLL